MTNTWGGRIADVFVSDVLHTLALLEKFPGGGMVEVPDLGIQSIPVARQVGLFYVVKGKHLLVLEFIDTRTAGSSGSEDKAMRALVDMGAIRPQEATATWMQFSALRRESHERK